MNNIVNPLAPPAPDFTPPAPNLEISGQAREFATAPIGLDARAPTDAEQVNRLVQARDILGARFWQEKAPPAATAAERVAADEALTRGVNASASASDYAVNIPNGVAPEAVTVIRDAMAGLQLSKPYGDYIGQRIVDVGRRIHGMSEAERAELASKEHRQIAEWGASKGWDLPKVTAAVHRLLSDAKVHPVIASIMTGDADTFIRLAMHAEHLKAVKKG